MGGWQDEEGERGEALGVRREGRGKALGVGMRGDVRYGTG